jgi:hypothetical protein
MKIKITGIENKKAKNIFGDKLSQELYEKILNLVDNAKYEDISIEYIESYIFPKVIQTLNN